MWGQGPWRGVYLPCRGHSATRVGSRGSTALFCSMAFDRLRPAVVLGPLSGFFSARTHDLTKLSHGSGPRSPLYDFCGFRGSVRNDTRVGAVDAMKSFSAPPCSWWRQLFPVDSRAMGSPTGGRPGHDDLGYGLHPGPSPETERDAMRAARRVIGYALVAFITVGSRLCWRAPAGHTTSPQLARGSALWPTAAAACEEHWRCWTTRVKAMPVRYCAHAQQLETADVSENGCARAGANGLEFGRWQTRFICARSLHFRPRHEVNLSLKFSVVSSTIWWAERPGSGEIPGVRDFATRRT